MAAKFIAVLSVLLEDHIDQNSAEVRIFFHAEHVKYFTIKNFLGEACSDCARKMLDKTRMPTRMPKSC